MDSNSTMQLGQSVPRPPLRFARQARDWTFQHWLLLANAATALILLGALAAPLIAAAGYGAAAEAIHTIYLLLCPQRPSHSYFLLGHQLALEHREIAMFGAQLSVGLAFAALRTRSSWRLDFRWFVVLSLPLAWDVLTQLFSVRESDWLTRSWTGGLFDAAFVLLFYPVVDDALRSRIRLSAPPCSSVPA